MNARLALALVVLTVGGSTTASAGDNPWTVIKQLFHEPVSELKQQFRQRRSPEPATTAPRPKAGAAASGVDDADAGPAVVPIPRPRPQDAIAYAPIGPQPQASRSAAAIGALIGPLPALKKPLPAARSTCGVALAELGVEAKPIAPIREGVCAVPEPVAVAALGGGAIDLTAKAVVGCQLAETFANWLEDDVQPAAQKLLGGAVIGLRVAASYACRPRNNVAGAKLSEHAHGNAIDIAAFNVAGHGWVEVGGLHGSAETRFLSTVRKSACGPFKTVLGPGSDSYHSSHFHLDLAQRNNRGPSRGLYCQ